MKNKKVDDYNSIKNSFFLMFIGAFFVIGVIVMSSLWIINAANESSIATVDELSNFYLEELAKGRADMISEDVKSYFSVIHETLNLVTDEDMQSEESLREFLLKAEEMYSVEEIAFIDKRGVVYTDKHTYTDNDEYKSIMRRVSSSHGRVISIVEKKRTEHYLVLAEPVDWIKFKDKDISACYVRTGFESAISKRMTNERDASETFFGIYDKNGQSLINADMGIFPPDHNIINQMRLADFDNGYSYNNLVSDFELGTKGGMSFTYNDFGGYFYYYPIEDTDWVMGVLIGNNVINSKVLNANKEIINRGLMQIILIVIILSAVFIIIFLRNRKITKDVLIAKEKDNQKVKDALSSAEYYQQEMESIYNAFESGSWNMNFDETGYMTGCTWSNVFREMLGFKNIKDFPNEMESFYNIIHDDDKGKVVDAFWDTVSDYTNQKSFDEEFRIHTQDRDWRWYKMVGKISRRPDGTPKVFFGMILDIDQRMQAQLALENAVIAAKQANVAKSNFLSNMSHELRTPINAVLGMDEMILRESSEMDIRGYALDIKNAGKSLLALINDVLDFSKIEAGKMDIIPVEYDLSSLVNDLINLIKMRAEQKRLDFNVIVDENIPMYLYGDEIRIKQIVTNLLTNAVKYTEKGTVTLSITIESADKYEAYYADDVDENDGDSKYVNLRFSVKDTGMGIKDEERDKLFKEFERLDEKKNRTVEGTGLGLSITKNLLNLMGSSLEVDSEYGKGSTFHFMLRQKVMNDTPIGDFTKRYNDTSKIEKKYHVLFKAPDARVLIVDDTEMNLIVLKGLLKSTKIQIDTATSGFDCIHLSEEKKYDMIFLDHRMPEMDGIETFQKLKEDPDNLNSDTPIIALTANAFSGAMEKYIQIGFDGYITKPVDGEKLEHMIISFLPKDKYTLVLDEEDYEDDPSNVIVSESERGLLEFRNIEDLDVDNGLALCQDPKNYRMAAQNFYDTLDSYIKLVNEYYNGEDWKNYNIKVHAIKSSSRLVGFNKLSSLAEKLEASSDEGNMEMDFIRENTETLLNLLARVKDHLSFLGKDEPEKDDNVVKPEIDVSTFKDGMRAVIEFIDSLDFESISFVTESMEDFSAPSEYRDSYEKFNEAVSGFDWDRAKEIAESIVK